MTYRLLLVCFLWGMFAMSTQGQRYFSKLKKFDQGAQAYDNIEELDSNLFWVPTLKFLPGSSISGYYYMDGEGNVIDSFFYGTKGLIAKALPTHNYFFKGDLIYQLCPYRDSENLHDIYVSSRSGRDSVYRFSVAFNRPEWLRTFANTMTLYQDTIYIFGTAQIRTSDPNEHDIFMVKMDLQGNTIWVKDLDQLEYYNFGVKIMGNVLQKDGFFYFTHMGDGPGTGGENTRVYKVSTQGEVIWRSAEEDRAVSVRSTHPDITFTADSSAIVWTNNRQLYLEDVGNDVEMWLNKCHNPISLTFLDMADGSFIKDYLYIIDSITNKFGVRKVITSKFNGDYIFCGVWEDVQRDQWYVPLIGRVSPSGAFKWVKLVADKWDNGFSALSFFSIEEAHNGDLVLVGTVERLPGETGPQPAWAMRIGPEGCVPDYVYCDEDTLIVNHPGIMVSSVAPHTQRKDLEIYPNPLSSGQTVYLGFPETGFPLRGVADVRWINAAGQPVAEQRLTLVEQAGYRTRVPLNIPPGMYFVEMRVGEQQYVSRVVVK